jgi:hypothetical protein
VAVRKLLSLVSCESSLEKISDPSLRILARGSISALYFVVGSWEPLACAFVGAFIYLASWTRHSSANLFIACPQTLSFMNFSPSMSTLYQLMSVYFHSIVSYDPTERETSDLEARNRISDVASLPWLAFLNAEQILCSVALSLLIRLNSV